MHKEITLIEAEKVFAQWRKERSGRRKIPERLWDMVGKISVEHSVHEITKVLHLDWHKVKKLRGKTASSGNGKEKTFMELPVFTNIINQMEIIIERKDGMRMIAKVSGDRELDMVLSKFLESNP